MFTASGIEATLPFLGDRARLAIRRTAITSVTSDSTACTTSATDGWSSRTSRSRRLRDSASAGNASSASNAAVNLRPWPSLWRWCRTFTAPAGVSGRGGLPASGAMVVSILGSTGLRDSPVLPYRPQSSGFLALWACPHEGIIYTGWALVAPKGSTRLKSPGGHGCPRHGHTDRLEHVLGLHP